MEISGQGSSGVKETGATTVVPELLEVTHRPERRVARRSQSDSLAAAG